MYLFSQNRIDSPRQYESITFDSKIKPIKALEPEYSVPGPAGVPLSTYTPHREVRERVAVPETGPSRRLEHVAVPETGPSKKRSKSTPSKFGSGRPKVVPSPKSR